MADQGLSKIGYLLGESRPIAARDRPLAGGEQMVTALVVIGHEGGDRVGHGESSG
jgi:hypothetical protein